MFGTCFIRVELSCESHNSLTLILFLHVLMHVLKMFRAAFLTRSKLTTVHACV